MQGCADAVGDGCSGYDANAFVAEFYDHVVPYRDRADVRFFVDEAVASGGPVCEVGCGTGRVLLPTARAGVAITGIDLSRRMLAVCRARLAVEPDAVRERVSLVEADMRGFDVGRRFALVTLPFRPFQHLITVDDQLACLRTLRRHCVDGGRLILDVFEPNLSILVAGPSEVPGGHEPEFEMPDGRRIRRSHRRRAIDLARQYFDGELIYDVAWPDGRREQLVHAFRMRWFYRYELEHLLARCGFAIETVYGGHQRQVYGSNYPGEVVCVARAA
jgi:SAM-dependent methyltransferase